MDGEPSFGIMLLKLSSPHNMLHTIILMKFDASLITVLNTKRFVNYLFWCCPSAVQELRQQMGGLQTQLQQVQLERSTLQSRLKTSQAEIDSLQQVRQWYQQQLALAQEARVRLQGEVANMQVRLSVTRAPPSTELMWYGVDMLFD